MLTKAIVESVVDKNHYKVRIPLYNKEKNAIGSTPTSNLNVATVCATQGTYPSYVEGDVVWVGFEQDLISKPVIIGELNNSLRISNLPELNCSSLQVDTNCNLPLDININGLSYQELRCLVDIKNNIQQQLDLLDARIKNLGG